MVKMMLDAGHGGKDPGAVAHGLQEKDLTLHLAVKAGAYLTSRYDCDVIYTRTKDVYLSPSERADLANEAGADLFCSFHINSAANPAARGFETFKFNGAAGKTAMLQILVHGAAVKVTDRHEVLDRGMKDENFAVLRETAMPAVLTETLFISNKEDARLLKSDAFLNSMAAAYGEGLARAAGAKERKAQAADNRLFRLHTGTFTGQAEADNQAEMLRKAYGWTIYVKEEG
ncbi:N-acetylmuramoyl-L-alanine amidase family protein [Domibacillus enclensis]|nr:N-acetylmuramoyl-L-alanine amidase [Domibacillus enclensis]SIR57238.1 N-acetylmuramoyl-L-alanine amidase [Domibacillus enclensis]